MKKALIIIWAVIFIGISGYTVYLLNNSRNEVNEINLPTPSTKNKKEAASQIAEALPIANFFMEKEATRSRAILFEYLTIIIGFSAIYFALSKILKK